MKHLTFCLTVVVILGRAIKAEKRSALYKAIPAADSQGVTKACLIECALENAAFGTAAVRVSSNPCTCNGNTIDWILQQPWDAQPGNVYLTKQQNFVQVHYMGLFQIPLPIQLSVAKMEVIVTSSGQLTGLMLNAWIDGNNRPLHMNMKLNEKTVTIASNVGGAWKYGFTVNMLPRVSSADINVTTVINAAGLMQMHSNVFPSTQFDSLALDVRQATSISIQCVPSCNLLQIDFQKLQ